MKTPFRAAACAIALTFPMAAIAQASAPAPAPASAPAAVDAAKLDKLRNRVRTDRKALVAQNLTLTEAEAKAFWPAYDKCQQSIEGAHRKVNRAIVEFIGAESRMTDAHAKQLMGEVLAAEADETKARKSCFDRVAKVPARPQGGALLPDRDQAGRAHPVRHRGDGAARRLRRRTCAALTACR